MEGYKRFFLVLCIFFVLVIGVAGGICYGVDFAAKEKSEDCALTTGVLKINTDENAADKNTSEKNAADKNAADENATDENAANIEKIKFDQDTRIRVILNNNDFSSYEQKIVEVSSDYDFYIEEKGKFKKKYSAGSSEKIKLDDYSKNDVVLIYCADPEGKIRIDSLKRGYGAPLYRGKLEIVVKKDYFYIINDILLEEYLYSVVSSEIPSGFLIEACKAMAVCARGYAVRRLLDDKYSKYNADIDDSTRCQMYNNFPETDKSIQAVTETRGIIPVYDNQPIEAFYFSTSAGVTASNSAIWGGEDFDYLKSNVESINKEEIDLSNEINFKKFMTDTSEYDIIEKDLPLYRWKISFSSREMNQAITSGQDLGDILQIEVTKRAKSGVAEAMVITGSKKEVTIEGQDNIRSIISPAKVRIICNDGSEICGWTSLPSGFFYVEKIEKGFEVLGGGFGHGVGLSQNGAMQLAKKGYDYSYILSHYYAYIKLENIYR